MTAQLLSSKEVARFVARGFLRFDGIVPAEVNEAAMEEIDRRLAAFGRDEGADASPPTGVRLSECYPEGSAIGAMLAQPVVAGAVESLVGPDPLFDHAFAHRREAGEAQSQRLHADAIVDPNVAFDIQVFYFPHEVRPGEGGTGFVPGSHLRRVNEAEVGRYHHVVGQQDFVGPAGSVLIFHHGLWHRGRPNSGSSVRRMYKVRLNPRVSQVRRWDTSDLAELTVPGDHLFARFSTTSIAHELRRREKWYGEPEYRLELVARARLWRYLTGDDTFDVDHYLTRRELRVQLA